MFIISLAIADLIVGSFVMPVATIYAINDVWIFSKSIVRILFVNNEYGNFFTWNLINVISLEK